MGEVVKYRIIVKYFGYLSIFGGGFGFGDVNRVDFYFEGWWGVAVLC